MALTSAWAGSSGWLQWWAGEEKEREIKDSWVLEEQVKSWGWADEQRERSEEQETRKKDPRWRCEVTEEYMGYVGCIWVMQTFAQGYVSHLTAQAILQDEQTACLPMHSGWKPLQVRLGRQVREMEPCSK